MRTETKPKKTNARTMPESETLLSLPSEACVQQIAFVDVVPDGQTVVHDLPFPVQKKAVVVPADGATSSEDSPDVDASRNGPQASIDHLQILTIPAHGQDDAEVLAAARAWVEHDGRGNDRGCLPILLQGAQLFWSPGRTAVIAPSDRMVGVRGALIEFCYFEAELRRIEREIGDRWPQLDLDTPLAFEFREQAVHKRKDLMERFQQVVSMRCQLVRMAPHIECPPIYPPTLASQVGERLKEKSRLAHRLQFLREQMDVFEKVYELCGQRSSDFMSSRTSHTLEWVIISLLAVETVLLVVDLLSSAGT